MSCCPRQRDKENRGMAGCVLLIIIAMVRLVMVLIHPKANRNSQDNIYTGKEDRHGSSAPPPSREINGCDYIFLVPLFFFFFPRLGLKCS